MVDSQSEGRDSRFAIRNSQSERVGLVDAVDHLLDRGAVLAGGATVSMGGVDLVYLGLNVVLSSVETLRANGHWPGSSGQWPVASGQQAGTGESRVASGQQRALHSGVQAQDSGPEPHSSLEIRDSGPNAERGAQNAEREAHSPLSDNGLARLVLTLVELLRQVMERQAVRRAEGGSLSQEEEERLGVALMELEAKMEEIKELFGLTDDDLNLDLGPLGRLD